MAGYELTDYDAASLDKMCVDSVELIKYARSVAIRQVNVVQTMTNYCTESGLWKHSKKVVNGQNMENKS